MTRPTALAVLAGALAAAAVIAAAARRMFIGNHIDLDPEA